MLCFKKSTVNLARSGPEPYLQKETSIDESHSFTPFYSKVGGQLKSNVPLLHLLLDHLLPRFLLNELFQVANLEFKCILAMLHFRGNC